MSNVKEISTRKIAYYFFNNKINIKDLDNIKIDEKSCKNVLIYDIGYGIPRSVKPLYLIIKKANEYIK